MSFLPLRPTVPDSKLNRQGTRAIARLGGTGPITTNSRASDVINGPWGDSYGSKQPSTFRYCFININSLPSIASHEKHDQIIQATTKYKINLLGLAEININYPRVRPTN
jgi:hypothetical protein